MKKIYFVISFFVFILLIVLFLKKEYNNKSYINDNIEIYYPVFNNYIDTYINEYIDSSIKTFNIKKYDSLFIDYDYHDNVISLYKYEFMNNILNYKEKDIYINKKSSYDLYNNKEIDNSKKIIAFTFDDGPNYNTNKILNILNKYNVTATFFILGSRIKGNEDIIKKMNEYNMEIGNHTYSHKLLTRLTEKNISLQIKKTDDLIYSIINRYPSLIRPSYGSVNNKIKKLSNRPIVIWNRDTLDWKYHNSKRIANKIIKEASSGDIILMHDIYSATANALEIAIPILLSRGYEIVSVSELFYYNSIDMKEGRVYGCVK